VTTIEEVRAEIELRREAAMPRAHYSDAMQLSDAARSGDVSALDEIWRRLGVHSLAAATQL